MLNLEVEIGAIRARMMQDQFYLGATQKQLVAMNVLISDVLRDANHRIPVIRYITGYTKLTSTKQLTRHVVSVIIDTIKDEEEEVWEVSQYGEELLLAVEDECERGHITISLIHSSAPQSATGSTT